MIRIVFDQKEKGWKMMRTLSNSGIKRGDILPLGERYVKLGIPSIVGDAH